MYAHDEIDVTTGVVQDLIAAQFPQLAWEPARFLDRGMDNAVFLAADVVFRFPVRRAAAEILRTEMAVVPSIASQLDIAISTPRYAGFPTASYPFVFAGFPYVAGTAVSDVALDDEHRKALTAALAGFLRALHALDPRSVEINDALPPDTIGRLDHSKRFPLVCQRLAHLRNELGPAEGERLMRFLERVAPQDREGARCIVHGDLYARHVLVDDLGKLSGIIDWGDVHFGNPAIDLAVAFYVLPPSHIDRFFEAYGTVDRRTLDLALYRALYHGVLVADLGLQWQRPLVAACGLRAIRTALAYR